MKTLTALLNIPWSLLGLILVVLSLPRSMEATSNALIFHVRSWWWTNLVPYMKNVRAATQGNVVLIGPNAEPKDREHELVHTEQYIRYPLIFPILYVIEFLQSGYQKNRFEDEAYRRAGNNYYRA